MIDIKEESKELRGDVDQLKEVSKSGFCHYCRCVETNYKYENIYICRNCQKRKMKHLDSDPVLVPHDQEHCTFCGSLTSFWAKTKKWGKEDDPDHDPYRTESGEERLIPVKYSNKQIISDPVLLEGPEIPVCETCAGKRGFLFIPINKGEMEKGKIVRNLDALEQVMQDCLIEEKYFITLDLKTMKIDQKFCHPQGLTLSI